MKFREELRDRSLFIEAGGGGGGWGLNKGNLADPLITFDDFREIPTPHVFIFQANLSGPPSESIKSFQRSPLWVLSYDRLPPPPPPICSPKNQVIPHLQKKNPPPKCRMFIRELYAKLRRWI